MDIKLLESTIKEAAQAYYDGESIMSDREFDKLVDMLREVKPDSYILNSVGWGMNIQSSPGSKTPHKYSVIGSLSKVKNFENIPNYLIENVIVSSKLDGISVVAYYNNGELEKAVTRGNGKIGIDVTDKFVKIASRVEFDNSHYIGNNYTGGIRGEFIIDNKNWSKMMDKYGRDIKSPRNTVSGIINRNDITEDIKYVSFIPYNIITDTEYTDQLKVLEDLERIFIDCDNLPYGFYNNLEDGILPKIYDMCRSYYPVDGLVITNKNIEGGYRQMAFKFETEKAQSEVIDIDWNLTRTSKLVPTVIINPVELSGATVKRASGFNAKYIEDNKITKGTIVEIMRSGGVIPDIQAVIFTPNCIEVLPTKCPICGHNLDRQGVDLVCNNEDCGNKDYRDLQSWVINLACSKVDNLGWTIADNFLDIKGIDRIEQLYVEEMKVLYTTNESSTATDKLIVAMLNKLINDSIDPVDALCALNIKRLGNSSANKIISSREVFKSLVDNSPNVEGLKKLVGPATTKSILESGKLERLSLISDRIDMSKVGSNNKNTDLRKICITGKLSMKRSDFVNMIKDRGYIEAPISKDTYCLITDNPDGNSSKNRKANELGIKKMSEKEFINMINS